VSDDVGIEMSEVFPACTVTRAMARQMEVEKPIEDRQSSNKDAIPCDSAAFTNW